MMDSNHPANQKWRHPNLSSHNITGMLIYNNNLSKKQVRIKNILVKLYFQPNHTGQVCNQAELKISRLIYQQCDGGADSLADRIDQMQREGFTDEAINGLAFDIDMLFLTDSFSTAFAKTRLATMHLINW